MRNDAVMLKAGLIVGWMEKDRPVLEAALQQPRQHELQT
jgi:hypothetical protein